MDTVELTGIFFPDQTTPEQNGFTVIIESGMTIGGPAGDYNGNGIVDAADYTAWRNTLGSTTNLSADGNGNGTVDTGDYGVWATGFGSVAGTGSQLVPTVPEPTNLFLLALALLPIWACARHHFPLARIFPVK